MPSTENQIFNGLYKNVVVAGDENLVPENIPRGKNMFGVDGTLDVVDTSDATATEEDIIEGKTAYVDGKKIIGTLVDESYNVSFDIELVEKQSSVTDTRLINQSIRKINTVLNTSNLISLAYGFYNCINLETIPKLTDTSNVNSMSYMFYNCILLTDIPLLNTSKVTNMAYMLYGCKSLTSIPLLDTNKVINMSYMLYGCEGLTSIPLLDTSSVTNMQMICGNCISLTNIPLLNTSKVTNMSQAFYNCESLIEIPSIDTSNVTNMYGTFNNCSKLEKVETLDASKVNYIDSVFVGCRSLKDFGGFWNIGKGYTQKTKYYTRYTVSVVQTILTYESVQNVINGLYDLNITYDVANGGTLYTQRFYPPSHNSDLLTEDDLALIASKGWTVMI